MQKPYRAVLIVQDAPKREVTLMAKSDFDALTQAKQALGADSHFELWEGGRRALTYRPSTIFKGSSSGEQSSPA